MKIKRNCMFYVNTFLRKGRKVGKVFNWECKWHFLTISSLANLFSYKFQTIITKFLNMELYVMSIYFWNYFYLTNAAVVLYLWNKNCCYKANTYCYKLSTIKSFIPTRSWAKACLLVHNVQVGGAWFSSHVCQFC